jgi:hypothetical protein
MFLGSLCSSAGAASVLQGQLRIGPIALTDEPAADA